MSQKPVDLDLAIESLKLEASTETMRSNARASFDKPHRSGFPKLAAVGLTSALAVAFLWPRGTSGVAFAQALGKTQNARRVHCVTTDTSGKATSEEWTYGDKNARLLYDKSGHLLMEWRTDGVQLFNCFNFMGEKRTNPNERVYGTIHKIKPGSIGPYMGAERGGKLEELLKIGKSEILGKETVSTPRGEMTKFRVKITSPFKTEMIVTVDNKTELIVETKSAKATWSSKIDYPDSIPDSVFEPRPQIATNVEVYDTAGQAKKIQETMKAGLGTSNGVTLRLVTLDYSGGLWAIWSGSKVSGKMERVYTASGVKLGPAYGLRKLTTSAKAKDYPAFLPDGTRIYGMGRTAFTKVGDTVDLTIPAAKGVATFKHVPVMRVGMPMAYLPWTNAYRNPEPAKK